MFQADRNVFLADNGVYVHLFDKLSISQQTGGLMKLSYPALSQPSPEIKIELKDSTSHEPQAGGCPQNTETVNYTTIQINKQSFIHHTQAKVIQGFY